MDQLPADHFNPPPKSCLSPMFEAFSYYSYFALVKVLLVSGEGGREAAFVAYFAFRECSRKATMLDESQQMLSEGFKLHHEAEGLTGEGDH